MENPDGYPLERQEVGSFDEEPKQPSNIPNVIEYALQKIDDAKDAIAATTTAAAASTTTAKTASGKTKKVASALTKDDVKYLFSGAPHFMLEKGRHNHWYPHVLFPWDTGLPMQDLWDREPMRHESFTLATLHAHLPVPTNLPSLKGDKTDDEACSNNNVAALHPQQKEGWQYEDGVKRSTYDLGIYEVPNMLSMNGKEPGAVGFRYFLELATADAVRYKRPIPKGESIGHHFLSNTPLTEVFDTLSHMRDPYSLCSPTVNIVLDRHKLLSEGPIGWKRIGVRDASVKDIVERLEQLSNIRLEALKQQPSESNHDKKVVTILDKQSSESLHKQLYSKFLLPPPKGWSHHHHEDIKGQIEALTRVLAVKGAWFDLSIPEWRLRVGQILWEMPPHADGDRVDYLKNGDSKPEDKTKSKHPTSTPTPASTLDNGLERKWLLFQLLLAGELLMRLDAIVQLAVLQHSRNMSVTVQDIRELDKLRHGKVNWDILFFQRVSDNLKFKYASQPSLTTKSPSPPSIPSEQQQQPSKNGTKQQHPLRSKLGSISQHFPLRHTNSGHPTQEASMVPSSLNPIWVCVVISPRRPERQLKGLAKFAEVIGWPGHETLETRIRSKVHREENETTKPLTSESVLSVYNTPVKNREVSKLFTKKDAYYKNLSHRYVVLHGENGDSSSNSNIGGWLSRSLLTGMVMPGECIDQFLMATVLETGPKALRTLGPVANLHGGLNFGDDDHAWTWWSTKCIIGRVLAASPGAKVCMGWVRVNVTPEEVDKRDNNNTVLYTLKNTWFSVEGVQESRQKNTRIRQGLRMAIDSNPLGKGRVANDTFTIPTDEDNTSQKSKDISMKMTKFMLSRQETPVEGLSEEAAKHIFVADRASVSFDINTTSETSSTTESVVFPLAYDVVFVSSYTCKPPRGLVTHLTHSNDEHDNDIDDNDISSHLQNPHLPGHPLHNSFKYKYIPLEDLRPDTRPPIITFQENASIQKNESDDQKSSDSDEHVSSNKDTKENHKEEEKELEPVWILDARSSNHEKDKEVFARAWCAAVGVHALVGRVGRTCLACCVREARAIGVGVVIRV